MPNPTDAATEAVSKTRPALDLKKWVEEIICGVGGFSDFCTYEGAPFEPKEAVTFVLRALANPECQSSADVLAAIQGHRVDVLCGEDAVAPRLGEIIQLVQDVAWTADSLGIPATASILRADAEYLGLVNQTVLESEPI